jgi:hypothetical protein
MNYAAIGIRNFALSYLLMRREETIGFELGVGKLGAGLLDGFFESQCAFWYLTNFNEMNSCSLYTVT